MAAAAVVEEEEREDERMEERIVFYKYHSEGEGWRRARVGLKHEEI